MSNDARLRELEAEVKALKSTLGTLIAWIAQSAVGVLSATEAQRLLEKLDEYDRPRGV